MKKDLREKAIALRRDGFSYSEILQEVPVAKSTLSLWLRSVALAKKQSQRLTEKKLLAIQRGWETRRKQRLDTTLVIKQDAFKEIKSISQKELLLMGTMLYWAEGSKSKEHNVSQGIAFSNSDPFMIRIFLKWLKQYLKIDDDRIVFDIYVHESSFERLSAIKAHWVNATGFPIAKFDKIYWKKNKIKTKRKNVGNQYYGLLRIKVKKSTNLNRKIAGLIEAITKQCGVV